MKTVASRWFILILAFLGVMTVAAENKAPPLTKGIYLTQSTLENTARLNYLIERAKKSGINTFVVDLEIPSKHYRDNIQLLKQNRLHYVARVTIFPNGGTPEQVKSEAYWEKKYRLIQLAVDYGADQIQLDYIRYNTKQRPSAQNSRDILKVINFFKDRLVPQNIPLQIDVFGVSSFGESKYIGQNVKLFASSIDVLCPMVYPSHYRPFPEHMAKPYETVYSSLKAVRAQFKDGQMPFKLNPYIELSNYHYPLTQSKKIDYIRAQIRAVEAAGADGWFAWSAHNQYDTLFNVLESTNVK